MKRALRPKPFMQRHKAHRARKAKARALHQVRAMRKMLIRGIHKRHQMGLYGTVNFEQVASTFHIPRLVRHHEKLLRATFRDFAA